ncbi:nucleotide sugar dehydrogenase [Nocardioides aquiterrae]|uniref:Nucleotide sugar dehydrogenase n=1 Tax=Nocardioides aquiterrae TaxID=203799 RepID=A0ABP4EZ09_9ACTN
MNIAVIGLGKIGLPLAAQFASKGHEVVGVDVNQLTVDTINSGCEPFPGEANLAEYVAHLVPAGALTATTDYASAVPAAEVIVVVVPLFVNQEGAPDFGWMDSATKDIGRNLTRGTTVIYETTLPVGTTRERWKPMLEQHSGLTEGTDFHVVFSPERVLTGRVFEDLRKYPKLVGGLTPDGARTATEFYRAVLEFDDRDDLARPNGVWDLGSAEAAELAKLAETTYRDVNIGLANQFAKFAEKAGIDVYQVIDACNSQPYSHIHRPGISVGGHCIPVYPRLYLSNDPDATVVRAARDANASMPTHAVSLLEDELGDLSGMRVAVLGVAYRPGVKESAFSGVFATVEALRSRGALVMTHDPLYDVAELLEMGLEPYRWGDEVDALIIHTDHEFYRSIEVTPIAGVKAIIDGRAMLATAGQDAPLIRTLGKGRL